MGGDNLSNNDRKKLDTILTVDVHIRDIIDEFVRDSIMDAMEFEWESQLRYLFCNKQVATPHLFKEYNTIVEEQNNIHFVVAPR